MSRAFFLTTALSLSTAAFAEDLPHDQEELATQLNRLDQVVIQSSTIALEMSEDPEVIAFAKAEMQEHLTANRVLGSLVKSEGLELQARANFDQAIASLSSFEGAAFRTAYAQLMIDVHGEAIRLLAAGSQGDLLGSPVGSLAFLLMDRSKADLESAKDLLHTRINSRGGRQIQ